jgi:hypothetical protein
MSVPCEPEPHPIGDVRCVSIDIERCEKAGLISIPFKHVDELVLCNNGAVFLIEHTGVPHEEDLEKLVETSARLGQLVPMLTGGDAPLRTTRRYYLIHTTGGDRNLFRKRILGDARFRRNPTIITNCSQDTWARVRSLV